MRRRLLLLLVLTLACGAWGVASAQEIVIGLNAELTGSIPVVGQSSRNAALMAVDEVNAAGGLLVGGTRRPVRLIIEDNQDNPAIAAAVAQKLIYQDRVVASFVYNDLGARRAAVLYDVASDYNKGIAEIFRSSFTELGGQVVAFETYTTGDRDFSSQLTRITALQPDVLFLPNYYSEVPLQIQQARNLGYSGPVVGSDSWGSAEIITLGGQAMEGQYFTTHYAPDIATPEARRFIEGYEARYGATPDDVAALTYDAFGMLFQAIQAAGSTDREAIREALAQITEFTGVTGTMSFRGSGDPEKTAVVLQIQEGAFRYFGSAAP
ncbi:ABC transporter substrate-binding protein [Limnochorda pilosa]|uniref:ABC transporter substrate-binding protein n=1 Tax=Limnochorda pilosa TaxID=1555112 RepID=UPI0026EFF203|nr:ABC transporter substrate-binding protein [Limnochorda pilosa]